MDQSQNHNHGRIIESSMRGRAIATLKMITKAMAMLMVAIFTVATVLFDDQNAARRTSVISDEQQKFDVRKVIRIG